jgi:transglutaminase-like putative cysteine protease
MAGRLITYAVLLILTGCADTNQLAYYNGRKTIEKDFTERERAFASGQIKLYEPGDRPVDRNLELCYRFILAYSPLNDLADLDRDFLLENASLALKSREDLPWGSGIPHDIFLHFVLPLRVNNENLDSFRIVYYNELKTRVAGMDAAEAALEVNRWCHERVAYQPSDIRTSSPMATILSSRGRCGEESTLTVAALRTAGIPARQVYTPRWAHCDDNHAWVEVWINGNWYYMGACEPEPVLDRGWFTEPARRAMLVHTKAFGNYTGNETVIRHEPYFAEINTLGKYAATKTIYVLVLDKEGSPVPDIEVEYQLYNYAEFFPIAKVPADEDGISRLITGFGDLIIWAGLNDRFGFEKISVELTDTVRLVMDKTQGYTGHHILNLSVPQAPEPLPGPSAEQIEHNRILLSRGDSIRESYINSWIQPDEAEEFSVKNGFLTSDLPDLIIKSHGNFREIMRFIENNPAHKYLALELLRQISEKDLRDTKEYILTEHLINAAKFEKSFSEDERSLFLNYVLNPRIANEMLACYRELLSDIGQNTTSHLDVTSPGDFYSLISGNIHFSDEENYYGTPLTPAGVHKLGITDSQSFDIYIVALFRSLGIPARLEPGTMLAQFWKNGVWYDADKTGENAASRATVSFTTEDSDSPPEYYTHFTIARFENGKFHTLEFDYNRKSTDFPDSVPVIPGNYMVVSGNRLNDNRILAKLSFFNLNSGEHLVIDVTPRKETTVVIYGNFPEALKLLSQNNEPLLLTPETAKGRMIAWIDPGMEPSRHLLNDLPRFKDDFQKWGGEILFLVNDSINIQKLKPWKDEMPANSIIAIDQKWEANSRIRELIRSGNTSLPFVLLTDKSGRILFLSSGYRTGISGQILEILR